MQLIDLDAHWGEIRYEASQIVAREQALKPLLDETVLDRSSFAECLTYRLARKLVNHSTSVKVLHEVFIETFTHEPMILQHVAFDMRAFYERDPASRIYSLLYI